MGGREGEEKRALFFSSFCSFILQKGCNQCSLERWYRVSHKTMQWPRRKGRATYEASTCSQLPELGQSPHCTAGHRWVPVVAPGLSRFYSVLPHPSLPNHPAGPAHAWAPCLVLLRMGFFHLSA